MLAVWMVDADIMLKRYLCFEHEGIGKWVHLETVYSSRQVQYGGGAPHAYSLDYHFEGNYAKMRPPFNGLQASIERFGEVTTYAKKYYIAFKRRSIFAVANVYASKIELGIHLQAASANPRLETAEDWNWSWITHHLTFAKESDVDDEAIRLVEESYKWARQWIIVVDDSGREVESALDGRAERLTEWLRTLVVRDS